MPKTHSGEIRARGRTFLLARLPHSLFHQSTFAWVGLTRVDCLFLFLLDCFSYAPGIGGVMGVLKASVAPHAHPQKWGCFARTAADFILTAQLSQIVLLDVKSQKYALMPS